MLRGPDLTGTPTVPIPPTPTKSVASTPAAERTAASSDAFRGTPEVVVVRQGDTLGDIAARYHVSIAELKELNPDLFTAGKDARGRKRAANGHWIYPGDRVRLRAGSGSASAEPSTETLTAQVRAARLNASQLDAGKPAAKAEAATEPTVQEPATEDTTRAVTAPESTPPEPVTEAATQPADPEPKSTEAATAAVTSQPIAASTEAPKPVEQVKAEQPKVEPAPKKAEPPAPPAKTANVYAVERYQPQQKPASPPPIPPVMAQGEPLNKNAKLIIGGLLAGLSLIKMPDKIEQSIGDNAVDEVLTKTPLYTRNPEIVRYVASVGAKLINQSERTDLDWRFYVVESPQINAFALPGGHVFITTAALRNLKSEAELAGVLGHEISHVEKRHSVKQLQKTLLAQGIAIAALGDQSAGVQVASQLAIGIAMNGYSRSHEDEADLRGAELAYKAGYDPKGLIHFFDTLKQVHPDSPEWMAWASDHPRTGDRIDHVTEHISKEGLTGHNDEGADRYRQVVSRL